MMSRCKELLKKNPLIHGLAKRARNFIWPHYRLPDLTAAWNKQYYFGDNLDLCFSLYRRNCEYQKRLATANETDGVPMKYLGPEWVSNIGTLAHLDAYVKIGLLGWRPEQQSVLTA